MADCGVNTTYRCLIRIDREPPASVVERAVQSAVGNCKAINLKYRKGKWYFSDYIPKFEFYQCESEDVCSHPISFLDYQKHTLLVSGLNHKATGNRYICVEFFHSACDGLSALNFVYEIFDALNERTTVKYVWDVYDVQITKKHATKKGDAFGLKPICMLKKPITCGEKPPSTTCVSTRYNRGGIAGKLSFALSKLFSNSDASVMIPVNVRNYSDEKDAFLCGNIALPLFLQVGGKGREQLTDEIKNKLKKGTVLSKTVTTCFWLDKFPRFINRFLMKQYLHYLKRKDRFVWCGLVSYLGEADLSRLVNPFFEVTDMLFQIGSLPVFGFTTVSLGFAGKLNVSLSCDPDRIDKSTQCRLIENIKTSVGSEVVV